VDDYGYKALFVTDFEPIYAMALIDPAHPLATDPTSPLVTDFKPHQFNQILRDLPVSAQVEEPMAMAMAG
jgi:hypothetical protein